MTQRKLRRYTTKSELPRMFGVSENSVKILFSLGFYSWRDSGKKLIFGHPETLSDILIHLTLNQTRVIIDGTECPIKKPMAPRAQQSIFATYKKTNTVKH